MSENPAAVFAVLALLRPQHAPTAALADAIADPDALIGALNKLDALPASPRRGSLATLSHCASVMPDIFDLIERTQHGNLDAARMLADIVAQAIQRPDRGVADAFRIEPSRDRRDRIVRDLAGGGIAPAAGRSHSSQAQTLPPALKRPPGSGRTRTLVATRSDRFA
jgi:hypothetical protein